MMICALAIAVLAPAEVFVSPLGDDRWSGRIAAPNRQRTDGPLRTLEAARDALADDGSAGFGRAHVVDSSGVAVAGKEH